MDIEFKITQRYSKIDLQNKKLLFEVETNCPYDTTFLLKKVQLKHLTLHKNSSIDILEYITENCWLNNSKKQKNQDLSLSNNHTFFIELSVNDEGINHFKDVSIEEIELQIFYTISINSKDIYLQYKERMLLAYNNSVMIKSVERNTKIYNKRLIFNFVFLIFIYALVFFWNQYNSDVYNQFIPQEYISTFLLLTLPFLGIDSSALYSIFNISNFRLWKLSNYLQSIINYDLKKKLSKPSSTFILFVIFIILLPILYYFYTPINISIKSNEYSLYVKEKDNIVKLSNKKVYLCDVDKVCVLYTKNSCDSTKNIERLSKNSIIIAHLNISYWNYISYFLFNSSKAELKAKYYAYKNEDDICVLDSTQITFYNPPKKLLEKKCYISLLNMIKKNDDNNLQDSTYTVNYDGKQDIISLKFKNHKSEPCMEAKRLTDIDVNSLIPPDSLVMRITSVKYNRLFEAYIDELKKYMVKYKCHPTKKTIMEAYNKMHNFIQKRASTYNRNITYISLLFKTIKYLKSEQSIYIPELTLQDLDSIKYKSLHIFTKNEDKLPDENIKYAYIRFSIFIRDFFQQDCSDKLFEFTKQLRDTLTSKNLPNLHMSYIEALVDNNLDFINNEEENYLHKLNIEKPLGHEFYSNIKSKCKNKASKLFYKLNEWEAINRKGANYYKY